MGDTVTLHCRSPPRDTAARPYFFAAAKRVRAAAFCAALFCLCHCVFFAVRSRFFLFTCFSAFLDSFNLALSSRVRAACMLASFVVSMADGILVMELKDSCRPVVACMGPSRGPSRHTPVSYRLGVHSVHAPYNIVITAMQVRRAAPSAGSKVR